MDLNYEIRRTVRHHFGPNAAAVYDVLAHHDTGEGTGIEMTAEELASEVNVSPKSVRRAITELAEAGWVTSEQQFQNNRQLANRYHLHPPIGGGRSDRPGGHDDQPIGTTTQKEEQEEVVLTTEEELLTTDSHSVVNPFSSVVPGNSPREGLRPSLALGSARGEPEGTDQRSPALGEDTGGLVKSRWRWPPRNSPMPMPVGGLNPGRKMYADVFNGALWLVSYFEGYVVERANQEKQDKGHKLIDEIPENRKSKWFDNAQELLFKHPLREVVEVVDYIFSIWSGYLPPWITEGSEFPMDSKVTRIRQVQEVYDDVVEEMVGYGDDPAYWLGPAVPRKRKINFNEPLADTDAEDKVTELVELFTEYRLLAGSAKAIHETQSWRWAKSFRVMLVHRGYEFEDVKMVVTALKDYYDMDRARYIDAYDLHRNDEWEHVLSAAKVARLRAERRASTRVQPRGRTDARRKVELDFSDSPEEELRSLDITNRAPRSLDYYSKNSPNR